jgi:hypothetical protein
MLQRLQSIWLLLAAAFAAITFRFPFYSGEREPGETTTGLAGSTPSSVFTDLNATTTIWLTILTVLTGAIAFVTIFLFSNRKLQLRLSLLGIFLTVILLVMYFLEMANYLQGNITIWAVFYFAILACFILAARGIYNDQALIKSMDRLR